MMEKQIVLGTLVKGTIKAVSRYGFPIKYWLDGPDGWGNDGWYYFNPDGGMDDGFTPHPFDKNPLDYPIILSGIEGYGLAQLVLVPDYKPTNDEGIIATRYATEKESVHYINLALRDNR